MKSFDFGGVVPEPVKCLQPELLKQKFEDNMSFRQILRQILS